MFLAVHGTGQVFSEVVPIAPEPPELKIIAPSTIPLGVVSKATIQFKNPLPVKMDNIILTVESDGLLNGEMTSDLHIV